MRVQYMSKMYTAIKYKIKGSTNDYVVIKQVNGEEKVKINYLDSFVFNREELKKLIADLSKNDTEIKE